MWNIVISILMMLSTFSQAAAEASIESTFAEYGIQVQIDSAVRCGRAQGECEAKRIIVVTGVSCNSPADSLGVEVGDIVIGHGNATIETENGPSEKALFFRLCCFGTQMAACGISSNGWKSARSTMMQKTSVVGVQEVAYK